MKTSLQVTTVVEITGVKTSYEIGEALKKAFKDIAYVNDELMDDNAQGYSFTFKTNVKVDLKALEKKVKDICDKTHKKEIQEEKDIKEKCRKAMEGFTGTTLLPVTNKYALMMDEMILSINHDILKHMKNKDYTMAESNWSDQQDLVTLRMLLNTKSREECYKFARGLDTYVREGIPDELYSYLVDGEEA